MNYTLHQLRVFLKVAELGSVTKAAESLNLTQPAVSSQLKLLQGQFGLPLTEVIGRKIHITEPGKEFAVMAKEVLFKAEELDERMNASMGTVSGKLRLAVVSTGKYFVPPILARFNQAYPEVSISLDVSNRRESETSLLDYEADFIIATSGPSLSGYETFEFLPNPLVLVAPGNRHGFELPKGSLTAKDLKSLPYIFREPGSGTRKRMEAFLKQQGVQPVIRMELVTNEAVKQLILAGFGVSFLSIYSLRLELLHNELTLLPHKDFPLQGNWSLVWLKGKKHTPATEAFLAFIKEHSGNWVDKLFPWVSKYI